MNLVRIGTRGSRLALWQANYVAEKLLKGGWNTQIVTIETRGDRELSTSISAIGSKGVFTEELEQQLRDGQIDIAVHSAKDMPSALDSDMEIIAFTEREDPSDVLVSNKDVKLGQGSLRVGTSSTRRTAFLRNLYPEVEIVPVRGNLQTRIRKMEEGACDALLLAYAGVHRMGYDHMIRENLDVSVLTPATGQGSVAVQSSTQLHAKIREAVRDLVNHEETERCLLAERAFLRTLEGGCSIPSFCLAQLETNELRVDAGIISLDGKQLIREMSTGPHVSAEMIGEELASKVLESGGREVLFEIRKDTGN